MAFASTAAGQKCSVDDIGCPVTVNTFRILGWVAPHTAFLFICPYGLRLPRMRRRLVHRVHASDRHSEHPRQFELILFWGAMIAKKGNRGPIWGALSARESPGGTRNTNLRMSPETSGFPRVRSEHSDLVRTVVYLWQFRSNHLASRTHRGQGHAKPSLKGWWWFLRMSNRQREFMSVPHLVIFMWD